MFTLPKTSNYDSEARINKRFVALSCFEIANDMREEIKEAFLNRPHLVDTVPGFLGMDVMRPVDNLDEIWLMTYWTDKNSFEDWHRGHSYKKAHKGIPHGLKLVPKSASVRYFDYLTD